MTNLEKLQKKYPSALEELIIEKKRDFNSALKACKALEGKEPFDEPEYNRIMAIAAALYEQIKASGEEIPAGAALKGFSL